MRNPACGTSKDIILFTRDEFLSWRHTTNHMGSIVLEGRKGPLWRNLTRTMPNNY